MLCEGYDSNSLVVRICVLNFSKSPFVFSIRNLNGFIFILQQAEKVASVELKYAKQKDRGRLNFCVFVWACLTSSYLWYAL
jgi:hypothetical protein